MTVFIAKVICSLNSLAMQYFGEKEKHRSKDNAVWVPFPAMVVPLFRITSELEAILLITSFLGGEIRRCNMAEGTQVV